MSHILEKLLSTCVVPLLETLRVREIHRIKQGVRVYSVTPYGGSLASPLCSLRWSLLCGSSCQLGGSIGGSIGVRMGGSRGCCKWLH